MPRKSRIVHSPGGKRGPKPKPVDLDKVRALASRGLSIEHIGDALGMHQSTFLERRKEHPEILEEIQKGRAEGVHVVANALFARARDGDVTAQIFFLKAKGGWKDRIELSGDPENPIRHVISAKPLSIEEWEQKYGEKRIEGERLEDETSEN